MIFTLSYTLRIRTSCSRLSRKRLSLVRHAIGCECEMDCNRWLCHITILFRISVQRCAGFYSVKQLENRYLVSATYICNPFLLRSPSVCCVLHRSLAVFFFFDRTIINISIAMNACKRSSVRRDGELERWRKIQKRCVAVIFISSDRKCTFL